MLRLLFAAAVLALGATTAAADSVTIHLVAVEGDSLTLPGPAREVSVVEQVPVTKVVVVNGVQRTVTEYVNVTRSVMRAANVKLKDVMVYDLDGLRVDPEKLPELLKKPRPVVVSSDGKVSKAVRDILKDGTLIVVVTPTK